jgi:hypothetical protein
VPKRRRSETDNFAAYIVSIFLEKDVSYGGSPNSRGDLCKAKSPSSNALFASANAAR